IATTVLCAVAVGSCGPRTAPLRLDAQYPESPRAPEGTPTAFRSPLRPDEFDGAVVDSSATKRDSAATSATPEERMAPMHHHGPAAAQSGSPSSMRSGRDKVASPLPGPHAAIYACPMHPDVTDTTASKCPKCGMTLVRRKEKP